MLTVKSVSSAVDPGYIGTRRTTGARHVSRRTTYDTLEVDVDTTQPVVRYDAGLMKKRFV